MSKDVTRRTGSEAARSSSGDVANFLDRLAQTPNLKTAGGKGRLVFAMDATASREPTWDRACHIQAEMFRETEVLGGLEVQLVFYRGFGECKASPWVDSSGDLVRRMTAVRCLGGQTQIGKVLRHTLKETEKKKVNAWSSSATAWRRTWTGCATTPAASACSGRPPSCSRRAASPSPCARSGRSPS